MTTYYRCDGSVTTVGNGNNQGLKCSAGWLLVDEPTFHLVSRQQADGLISAFLGLIAIVIVFRILYKTFG